MIRKEFIVAENQRGLLVKDGRLLRMLDPGRHVLWDWDNRLRTEIVPA
jgi:regulator of protease activity HflC (stomatin/prohibitin superfamily)